MRRQRQNRLRWQRQQQRRQHWRKRAGAVAGVAGLLLVAVGAVVAIDHGLSTLSPAPQAAASVPPADRPTAPRTLATAMPIPVEKPAGEAAPPLAPLLAPVRNAAAPAPPPRAATSEPALPRRMPATQRPLPDEMAALPPAPVPHTPVAGAAAPPPPPPVPVLRMTPPPARSHGEVALAALPMPPPAPTLSAPPADDATLPAWRRFAAVAPLADGPMIAIIIDDVGLNASRTRAAIELPAPVTLSFLPYGVYAADLAVVARAAGHEVMLHLPMQPEDDAENPGPKALRVDLGPAELAARLDWYLGHLPGYVGVNNHMGSRFTQSADGMALVMRALRQRGLLFVDSVTSPRSVGLASARRAGVPSLARDVFLDNAINGRQIAAQLAETEAVARRHGQAIAIGHPHVETVEALRVWLQTLRAKGFTLAPVSALLRRQQAS